MPRMYASWLNAHIWANALHIWSNVQFAKCTRSRLKTGPVWPRHIRIALDCSWHWFIMSCNNRGLTHLGFWNNFGHFQSVPLTTLTTATTTINTTTTCCSSNFSSICTDCHTSCINSTDSIHCFSTVVQVQIVASSCIHTAQVNTPLQSMMSHIAILYCTTTYIPAHLLNLLKATSTEALTAYFILSYTLMYVTCLSSAKHGQNINLPVCVCLCPCPSHFLSTLLQQIFYSW